MKSQLPELDGFYELLGKVVLVSAQLQVVIGSIPFHAKHGAGAGNDWIVASGGVGKVDKAMKDFLAEHPDDAELGEFFAQVKAVQRERNDLAHSVVVVGDSRALEQHNRTTHLLQTRDGARRSLPTESEAEALLDRMVALIRAGAALAERYRRST